MFRTRTVRGIGVGAGILVASLALAACQGGTATPEESEGSSGELVTADIVAATGPQLSNVNLYIGEEEGIFEEHGLTVTNETLTAGPDAIPQLLSGAWQFAMVDTVTAIRAAIEDVPVTTVAAQTLGVEGDLGYAAIMVGADSGIEELTDLEGKKLQVNALGGTAEALVRATVTDAGGDPDKIEFVEVPPPNAIPAWQAGQVDALFLSEPLIGVAEDLGMVDIGNPEGPLKGAPSFVWMTSKQYAQENPEVVAQFQAAIAEASVLANSDHDLALEVAATSTTVEPALLEKITRFPSFGEKPITAADVQVFIDLLVKYGNLENPPSGEDVIWAP